MVRACVVVCRAGVSARSHLLEFVRQLEEVVRVVIDLHAWRPRRPGELVAHGDVERVILQIVRNAPGVSLAYKKPLYSSEAKIQEHWLRGVRRRQLFVLSALSPSLVDLCPRQGQHDAEDLLRAVDDKSLRQRIEDADRSRADKLDKLVVDIEGVLNPMGLMSVEPSQIRDETTSGIDGEVVGRVPQPFWPPPPSPSTLASPVALADLAVRTVTHPPRRAGPDGRCNYTAGHIDALSYTETW
ncbi:hypothetical protein HU200_043833 [Digitaria exilis]|uniref:Uncharacterized protein n=1 Tax=Digitaria exilis TaxID=1010633 RepID=A0A835BDN4_9POAL|nr:hypothetical protein HU200_043833 [Digitaria exilis]